MDVSDNHFYDGLKDCNLVRELVKKERGLIRAGLGLGHMAHLSYPGTAFCITDRAEAEGIQVTRPAVEQHFGSREGADTVQI